jgi:hypothetical protein
MRIVIIGAAVLVCMFAAGGCTALKMKPQGEFGVGGSGHVLGVDVVTDEANKRAEEVMDAQWAKWNADTRGMQLTYALVAESDLRCDRYLTAVSIDRNATRGSLDIAGLALAAIGGVASPNTSANWFSAGSTLAQSSRRSLEDTVLGGREFGLIYAAVWKGREDAAETLLGRAKAGEFRTWDWRPILSLARQYDVKCGLNYGLGRLGQAIATSS